MSIGGVVTDKRKERSSTVFQGDGPSSIGVSDLLALNQANFSLIMAHYPIFGRIPGGTDAAMALARLGYNGNQLLEAVHEVLNATGAQDTLTKVRARKDSEQLDWWNGLTQGEQSYFLGQGFQVPEPEERHGSWWGKAAEALGDVPGLGPYLLEPALKVSAAGLGLAQQAYRVVSEKLASNDFPGGLTPVTHPLVSSGTSNMPAFLAAMEQRHPGAAEERYGIPYADLVGNDKFDSARDLQRWSNFRRLNPEMAIPEAKAKFEKSRGWAQVWDATEAGKPWYDPGDEAEALDFLRDPQTGKDDLDAFTIAKMHAMGISQEEMVQAVIGGTARVDSPEARLVFQKILELQDRPGYHQAVTKLKGAGISPGKEFARAFGVEYVGPNGSLTRPWDMSVHQIMSGSVDAVFSWFADPTLVAGKGLKALRTLRGVQAVDDIGKWRNAIRSHVPATLRPGLLPTTTDATFSGSRMRVIRAGGAADRSKAILAGLSDFADNAYSVINDAYLLSDGNWMSRVDRAGLSNAEAGALKVVIDPDKAAWALFQRHHRMTGRGFMSLQEWDRLEKAVGRRGLRPGMVGADDMMAWLGDQATGLNLISGGLLQKSVAPVMQLPSLNRAQKVGLFVKSSALKAIDFANDWEGPLQRLTGGPLNRGIRPGLARFLGSLGDRLPEHFDEMDLASDIAAQEFYRFVQQGRWFGVKAAQRNEFLGSFLRGVSQNPSPYGVVGRHQVAMTFTETLIRRAGFDDFEARKMMEQMGTRRSAIGKHNMYKVGDIEVDLPVWGTETVVTMPSLRDLFQHGQKYTFMRRVGGWFNNQGVEAFMSGIWKPSVLFRLGFPIRAFSEEAANIVLRHGPTAYLKAMLAATATRHTPQAVERLGAKEAFVFRALSFPADILNRTISSFAYRSLRRTEADRLAAGLPLTDASMSWVAKRALDRREQVITDLLDRARNRGEHVAREAVSDDAVRVALEHEGGLVGPLNRVDHFFRVTASEWWGKLQQAGLALVAGPEAAKWLEGAKAAYGLTDNPIVNNAFLNSISARLHNPLYDAFGESRHPLAVEVVAANGQVRTLRMGVGGKVVAYNIDSPTFQFWLARQLDEMYGDPQARQVLREVSGYADSETIRSLADLGRKKPLMRPPKDGEAPELPAAVTPVVVAEAERTLANLRVALGYFRADDEFEAALKEYLSHRATRDELIEKVKAYTDDLAGDIEDEVLTKELAGSVMSQMGLLTVALETMPPSVLELLMSKAPLTHVTKENAVEKLSALFREMDLDPRFFDEVRSRPQALQTRDGRRVAVAPPKGFTEVYAPVFTPNDAKRVYQDLHLMVGWVDGPDGTKLASYAKIEEAMEAAGLSPAARTFLVKALDAMELNLPAGQGRFYQALAKAKRDRANTFMFGLNATTDRAIVEELAKFLSSRKVLAIVPNPPKGKGYKGMVGHRVIDDSRYPFQPVSVARREWDSPLRGPEGKKVLDEEGNPITERKAWDREVLGYEFRHEDLVDDGWEQVGGQVTQAEALYDYSVVRAQHMVEALMGQNGTWLSEFVGKMVRERRAPDIRDIIHAEGRRLPKDVIGRELFEPRLLSKLTSGFFNETVGPMIDAMARTPLFIINYVEALGQMQGIRNLLTNHALRNEAATVAERFGMGPDDLAERVLRGRMMDTPSFVADYKALAGGKAVPPGVAGRYSREGNGLAALIAATDDDAKRALLRLPPGAREKVLPQLSRQEQKTLIEWAEHYDRVRSMQMEVATKNAVERSIPFIDDHRVRTQFSDILRNVLPFHYAEEQFLKRWMRTMVQSPEALRRGALLMNGITSSGFFTRDEDGTLIFNYPGSRFLAEAMMGAPVLGEVLFGNPIGVPQSIGFHGKVKYTWAGTDRLGMPSVGPIFAVHWKAAKRIFPELGKFDKAVFGERAYDTGMFETLAPAWFVRGLRATKMGDRLFGGMEGDRALASATQQALAMFLATDDKRRAEGKEPLYFTDDVVSDPLRTEALLERIRDTARGIVFTGVMLGAQGPMPVQVDWPSEPFSQEFLQYMQAYGSEEGMRAFYERYPDATAYTIFASDVPSGANIATTKEAFEVFQEHEAFMSRYSLASAWLLPEPRVGDRFDRRAYYDQVTRGVRTRDMSLDNWLAQYYYRRDANEYFATDDMYKQGVLAFRVERDKAERAGDDIRRERASLQMGTLQQERAAWKEAYKKQHPVFWRELESPEGRQRREQVIDQLRVALDDPDLPEPERAAAMKEVIAAYDTYVARSYILKADTTARGRAVWRAFQLHFLDWGDRYALAYPDAAHLWTSVVRRQAMIDEDALLALEVA